MATRVLMIFAGILLLSNLANSENNRILGGHEVTITDYKYVASVRLDNVHVCGGNIISNSHILTTARCLQKDSKRYILLTVVNTIMAIKHVFVLLLNLTVFVLALASPTSRILGGEDSQSAQYPWAVSVRLSNVHKCGGTIITEKHIITASHCVSRELTQPVDVGLVTVRVGSINQYSAGRVVTVKKISINTSTNSFLHDLAIIELDEALTFTTKINKIEYSKDVDELTTGDEITVAGWGELIGGASPYKLQQATYTVMSPQLCELEAGYGYNSIICMAHNKNEGICTGDDGAGVISNGKLVGVVSFAFGNCGTSLPDIAAKVGYYTSWIESKTT